MVWYSIRISVLSNYLFLRHKHSNMTLCFSIPSFKLLVSNMLTEEEEHCWTDDEKRKQFYFRFEKLSFMAHFHKKIIYLWYVESLVASITISNYSQSVNVWHDIYIYWTQSGAVKIETNGLQVCFIDEISGPPWGLMHYSRPFLTL